MEDRVIDAGFATHAAASTSGPDYGQIIGIISQWRHILNARLLALLALIGALGVFSFTVYDPSTLRLWGASLYSMGVLWPVMYLASRKG